jgi:hypothetical protein
LTVNPVVSQQNDGYGVNLPKFYKTKLHFGFVIAGNSTDFRLNPKPNSLLPDTLIDNTYYKVKTVYSESVPGFAIGPVVDLKLQQYIRLRFTPTISFGTRKINYGLANAARDSFKVFQKTVESVFLLFPIETKIQSKRMGNFGAYVIGGAGYSLDLSARKKTAGSSGAANQLDENVKLKRDDIFYSAGAGTDFYLQYFKLGFELKLLIGTKNLLQSFKHKSSFCHKYHQLDQGISPNFFAAAQIHIYIGPTFLGCFS